MMDLTAPSPYQEGRCGMNEISQVLKRHINILRPLLRFGASLLQIDISPRSLALGQRQQPRIKQRSL